MILLQKILKSNWFFGIVLLLIGFIYFQNSDKEFGWTNKKHFHNFSVKADVQVIMLIYQNCFTIRMIITF
jgi:hypothetical protein